MSVVFGLISFRDIDVASILHLIHDGSCPNINNGSRYWYENGVGLGNILRINTPESILEEMPYSLNNYVVSSYARIDNRDILFRYFSIPKDQQCNVTDSFLILKAYEKWRENCIHYIEGDWAFAIWDKNEKKLFIARDPLGTTGMYYHCSSKYFAFCSSVKGILALPDLIKSPNEKFLGGVLSFYLPFEGESPYNNIFSLQPGHYLTLQNSVIKKERYFIIENTCQINYKRLEDYIFRFLELYENSIKSRLRSVGKIGSTLSGGLDSGSITALTARELAISSKRIQTFTYRPFNKVISFDSETRFVDESVYAKATADYCGNVDITFVSGEEFSVIKELKEWDRITDIPCRSAGNQYWILDLLNTANKNEISTLFVGDEGNTTVSWGGSDHYDTLQNLIKKFHKNDINLIALLKKIIATTAPKTVRTIKNFISNYSNPWRLDSPISLELEKRINLQEVFRQNEPLKLFPENDFPSAYRCSIMEPYNNIGGLIHQQLGFEYNLHLTDPTTDKQLMLYCFSIPDKFFRNDSYDRLLIRTAMKSILPDEVRLNRKRGLQGADNPDRVKRDYQEILNTLNEFNKSPFIKEFIDTKKLLSELEKIKKGSNNYRSAVNIVKRGISVGFFLQRFEKY